MQNTNHTNNTAHCWRTREAVFVEYCKSFYDKDYTRPDGRAVYPYYTAEQIETAARLHIASAPWVFEGDSIDRERVRALMDMAEKV